METSVLAVLAVIVTGGALVGTVTGFGSSIIALTFGAQLLALDLLVPIVVPLNLALTSYLVVRHHAAADWRLLWRRVMPLTGVGLPIGLAIFHFVHVEALRAGFGLFVVLLAAFELVTTLRARPDRPTRPLGGLASAGWLFGGGLVHGLWVSGGPLIAYWAARTLRDKAVFRATLTVMWVILNTVVLAGHIVGGTETWAAVRTSAILLVPLAVGVAAGEWLHDRIPERHFRVLVFVLLIFAGGAILVRG